MKSIELIKSLEKEFNKHSNPNTARLQKAYMRSQFEFFGLTAKKRREIQKKLFQDLEINDLNKFIYSLWNLNKRDFQYLGQDQAQL